MRVRMITNITGYHDGLEWPAPPGELDVSDAEADQLIANGYAEPVDGTVVNQSAAAPADDVVEATAEATTPSRRRKAPPRTKKS